MIHGGCGSSSFGSVLQDPGTIVDPTASRPFTLEINHTDWRDWFSVDSLQLNDTLGQPMSCEFILTNPSTKPKPGDLVRALYFSEVLFAGLMDRAEPQPNTDLSVIRYQCKAIDWSILLTRRRLRRNFTNLPVINIVDSILDNELAGDGLSIGTIDQGATIPLVDVKNARAFDVLRDVAAATGQAMYVDFDKAIQFRTTSNEAAPKVLDNTTVEASSLVEDLETYRNVQTVIVTGTAPQGVEANSVTVERTNANQIAARIAIEGGSGRYEDIEEVTHPTSNAGADLALMGIGYANLRLATSGTPRKTLRARVRGYGFRAGQFATVDLSGVGASGTWLIQRCQFRERAARYLVFDLELTQSSRQQRALEAWLAIVRAGKIVVQLPASITTNLVTFDTPGSTTWTVPAGVTSAQFTCVGGSGGGSDTSCFDSFTGSYRGGNGGASGLAVTTVAVSEGQVFAITVGAAGIEAAPSGVDGTHSMVSLSGIICQGNGGGGGGSAVSGAGRCQVATDGTPGSGIGDAITIGGGPAGGLGAVFAVSAATPGQDGYVKVEW